jgi:predicted MFS family arabinose efflux permease
MKKSIFKTIAWIGAILLVIGAVISFYSSWALMTAEPGEIGVDFGHWLAIIFGIPGIVLMIIGGLIAKPKYFWFVSITAGLFYILSFFSMYSQFPDSQIKYILQTLSFSFLPGLIPVFMGWQLRNAHKKDDTVS